MKNTVRSEVPEVRYTWPEFTRDCLLLAKQVEPIRCEFDTVYGLPRGGLTLAVMLCHRFRKFLIMDEEKIDHRTLVVDDISDTGRQLMTILSKKKPLAVATLWVHPQTEIIPNFWVRMKGKKWIRYPWELTPLD